MSIVGHYNFGLTALEVGIPGNIPNRGAGWAQEQSGNGYPLFGHWLDWPSNTSFGDDPRDQMWINEGILASENNFHTPNACYGF